MAHKHIPAMQPATRGLLGAYLEARYEVHGPGGILLLRPGQPAPQGLDAVLPAARWTLITASNPGSQPRSGADNHRAHAILQAGLDALGLRRLPTLASDTQGNWPEPGWLVADLSTADTDALARRFGQAGVLHWRTGEAVRLRIYLAPPADGLEGIDTTCVEWVVPPP
ncbi:DUF3293 domain-containing protein [Pseudoxanthomonas suwonensis]